MLFWTKVVQSRRFTAPPRIRRTSNDSSIIKFVIPAFSFSHQQQTLSNIDAKWDETVTYRFSVWVSTCFGNKNRSKITSEQQERNRTSGHGCSKNDSLIWNKIRAQLHGSVHPAHSVTLMGGGEQESQPVRSQSARPKKQERLKKKNMERITKVLLSETSRRPCCPPSWPRTWPPDPSQGSPASSPASPFLSPAGGRRRDPPESWVRPAWRRTEDGPHAGSGRLRLSEGRGHTEIMAPAERSVPQSLCCF